jgi:uncharacterized tellurite resistance protein B-like protein
MHTGYYMSSILKDIYKEILTLPEDKAKECYEKAEQLLHEKNITFTKFATIMNKWIDEQKRVIDLEDCEDIE